MATEMINKPIEEALALTNKAVAEALDGLPPVKMHCSVLAEEAVKAAVKDYFDKKALPMTQRNPLTAKVAVTAKLISAGKIFRN